MIESSMVLHRGNIIDYNIGNFCSVEFNFERIWNYCKENNLKGSNIDFVHVHPEGFLQLSDKDKNCMLGFQQAFKSEIYFNIISFKDNDLFSIESDFITYSLGINKNICTFYHNFKDIILEQNDILFLKYLSYGLIK